MRHDTDTSFELGAITVTMSLARDYFAEASGVIVPSEDSRVKRAESLLSETTRVFQQMLIWWLPCGYLTRIRYKYPDGVNSIDQSLVYW